ncbi:MAG: hypothetical protein ACIAXF_09950 [Phycisphaerales bacterium JB063]
MANVGELWTRFKEQEVVSYKLVLAIPVLAAIGVIVLVVMKMSGGQDVGIGSATETYYCAFDDATVSLSNEELYEWVKAGDAILKRGPGAPTRVRCPECGNPSCILPIRGTDQEVELDPEWDLTNWTAPQTDRGGRVQN